MIVIRVVSAANQCIRLLTVSGVLNVIVLVAAEVFYGRLANVAAVSVLVLVNRTGMLYSYRISMINYSTFFLLKAYGTNTNP